MSADLRLLFWLIILLVQVIVGDWVRAAARALRLKTSRAHDRVPGRLSLLFLKEQPWALALYALCLLVGDTSHTSR